MGNRSTKLTWADPGNATITRYEYRMRDENALAYGGWVPIVGSGATTTSHTVSGLTNGTTYTIVLRAVNATGPSNGTGPARVTPAVVPTLALELNPAQTRENAPATVTVTARIKNGPLATPTQVTLTAAHGTAGADDYSLPQTLPQISIAAGQSAGTTTLLVTPQDDAKDELDESFTLNAEATSSVLGQKKLTAAADFTILDEDDPPLMALILSSAEALESGTAATVTVTARLSGAVREPDTTITVSVAESSTAIAGTDYTAAGLPAEITIAGNGQADAGTAIVTVTPINDDLSEPHETIDLQGRAVGLESTTTAFTLRDDEDPTLSLSLSLARIRENEEAKAVTVTVATNRAIEGSEAATVTLALGGTATPIEDYALEPALPRVLIPVGQSSVTTASTLTPVQDSMVEGEETIVVMATGADLLPGEATVILWEYDMEAEKAILSEALTEIAQGTLASVRHVLSGRFHRLGAGNGNGNGMRVAGISSELFESSDAAAAPGLPGEGGAGEGEAFRIDSQTWWRDSAFEYRFQKRRRYFEDVHWSLWGQGDYVDFAGALEGQGSYDGDVRAAYFGMDARVVGEWVAGLAVAHSRGRADYRLEENAGGITGLMKTEMTSAHPYLSVEWSDGFEAWAMLGAGEGDIKLERQGGREDLEKSDLSMMMGAFGFRRTLVAGGANGPHWALLADASYAEFETDDGVPVIDNLNVSMYQARFGLEYACSAPMAGGRVESYAQAHARYDGGDGIEGAGLELVGGLRYATVTGWEVDAQGRWLAAHSESDYEEHGMSLAVKKEWGKDQRGLYLLLVPRWGAPTESSEAVWGGGAFEMQELMAQTAAFMLSAEIGYGAFLPLIGRQVAWFGEVECGSGDRWRMRAGARLGMPQAQIPSFGVEVFGAYESGEGAPESSINVQSTLSY